MRTSVYAGSFDPPTWGHQDILSQALSVFDKVCVLISENPKKKYMFTLGERKEIWEEIRKHRDWKDRVEIEILPPAIYAVMYARDNNYTHMVRGLRNTRDFEEELVLRDVNERIWRAIRTVYFVARPEQRVISSSLVKDIMGYRWWTHLLDNLVPYDSAKAILKKMNMEREE